jgi:hypothetical protein
MTQQKFHVEIDFDIFTIHVVFYQVQPLVGGVVHSHLSEFENVLLGTWS